jgi:pimeloyl-ACP methyl ester carboxylesterase
MDGKWIKVDNGEMFVRLTGIDGFDRNRPTILLVHGLGESGACFAEALDWFGECNIVIPDLLGFGHSRAASNGDHSTIAQAKRVLQLIERLNPHDVYLIGHSWGGDVGTLVCSMNSRSIKAYFNVEGDLHHDNIIVSRAASNAFKSLDTDGFERCLWEEGFKDLVLGWNHPAALRYFASVRLCDPVVFGKTASEIIEQCDKADNNGIVEWGRIFAALPIPSIYCWGTKSLDESSSSIDFLNKRNIEHKSFKGASHWVMQDAATEFYRFVRSRVVVW